MKELTPQEKQSLSTLLRLSRSNLKTNSPDFVSKAVVYLHESLDTTLQEKALLRYQLNIALTVLKSLVDSGVKVPYSVQVLLNNVKEERNV